MNKAKTYNPAESKPRITLGDVGGHVAAVVALAYHALIAFDFLSEGVLSAHKEEEHCQICKRDDDEIRPGRVDG